MTCPPSAADSTEYGPSRRGERPVFLFYGIPGPNMATGCRVTPLEAAFCLSPYNLTVPALKWCCGASQCVAPSMSKAPAMGGGRRSGAARPWRPSGRQGNAEGDAPALSPAGPSAFYLPIPVRVPASKNRPFCFSRRKRKKISGTLPYSSLRARGVGLSTPRAQLCHKPGTPMAIGFLAHSRTFVLITGSRKIRGRIKGKNRGIIGE